MILAALSCSAVLGYMAGIRQANPGTAAPTKTYVLNLGALHLNLTLGAMGVLVIFLLTILFAAALLFAAVAGRRRRQSEAANRLLEEEIKERTRAQEEVTMLNAVLENRVSERTVQLRDANQQLEAFSYSVAHDLKAPLRAISGFSTMLAEDYGPKLDGDALRYLCSITEKVGTMGQLINDLLEFSRQGFKEMELFDIDMSEVVTSILAELRSTTPGRQLEWRVQPLPPVRGDLAMIRQVWVNLLSNAIKFSGTTGKAWVEVGCSDAGERQNTYYVRDNGAGFDMKYVDKLFGIFQRLHSGKDFEGTGVGLSIVQRVVQRHGGRVWAEGKVNEGATFHFTLPVASEAKSQRAQSASSGV
jgi:light-regulated signal transduction histidine kinase (bacteriophytochrome)